MNTAKTFTGLDRFIFGAADPGELIVANGNLFRFVGDFGRLKDAKAAHLAAISRDNKEDKGAVSYYRGYLFGNRRRGWCVYSVTPCANLEVQS